MARRRSVWFVATAVGALLGALGVVGASAAPPATADATAVMQWNIIAVSTDHRRSRSGASRASGRSTTGISNQHGDGSGGCL